MLTQLNKHPTLRQLKLRKANANLPTFYARSGPLNLGSKTPSINPSPIPPSSIHHQSIFCHFIAECGCNKWCYLTELSCGLDTPISGVGHPSPVWWGVGALSPLRPAQARFSPGVCEGIQGEDPRPSLSLCHDLYQRFFLVIFLFLARFHCNIPHHTTLI